MQLEHSQQSGYVLAECEGQLDATSHQAFRDALHPLFTERGVNVVVDLSGSKWVNSEGISAMVRLVADANTKGCRVIYAAPNAFVQEVLQVTRLSKFFDVAPSRAAAVEMLNVVGGGQT